jgi:hypothetical protein
MQVIEHKGKKHNVPTSWGEINTGTYVKLSNMIKMFQDEEGNLTVDDEALFPRIAEILTGINRNEILDMDFIDVVKIKNNLTFLSDAPKVQVKQMSIFKHGKYVIKIKEFDRLTFGEFIDIQHLRDIADGDIIKAMANLIDVYESKDILKLKFKDRKLDLTLDDKVRFMNELPCLQYSNLSFFLLNGFRKSMRIITRYLMVRALVLNMKQILPSLGLTIYGSWIWLKMTLLKSKKQHQSMSEKH